MSTSIGLVTPEGVVLASDSRTTISDPRNPIPAAKTDGRRDARNAAFHIDGVAKLWSGRRAAATWSSLIGVTTRFQREFVRHLEKNDALCVDELALSVHQVLPKRSFLVLLGGYSREGRGELWMVGDEEDGPRNVTEVEGRKFWHCCGRNEAAMRLFGDCAVPLEGKGANGRYLKLQSTIDPENMTLQAAVDFVCFYLQGLVPHMEALRNRGQGVGGPVDVAVLSKDGLYNQYRVGTYSTQLVSRITL